MFLSLFFFPFFFFFSKFSLDVWPLHASSQSKLLKQLCCVFCFCFFLLEEMDHLRPPNAASKLRKKLLFFSFLSERKNRLHLVPPVFLHVRYQILTIESLGLFCVQLPRVCA